MSASEMHSEEIKAELRKRFGTVFAFEDAANLPRKSVSDFLRGRSSRRVRDAILAAIDLPAAQPEHPEGRGMSVSPTEEQLFAARILGFRKGMESAQRLSLVGGEVADEADQVREALKVVRRLGPSVLAQQVRQFVRVFCGAVGAAWQQLLGRGDVSLDQVVQGVEAVGQGRDHAASPSNGYADDEETIARRIHAHRLSETSK